MIYGNIVEAACSGCEEKKIGLENGEALRQLHNNRRHSGSVRTGLLQYSLLQGPLFLYEISLILVTSERRSSLILGTFVLRPPEPYFFRHLRRIG